ATAMCFGIERAVAGAVVGRAARQAVYGPVARRRKTSRRRRCGLCAGLCGGDGVRRMRAACRRGVGASAAVGATGGAGLPGWLHAEVAQARGAAGKGESRTVSGPGAAAGNWPRRLGTRRNGRERRALGTAPPAPSRLIAARARA